MKGIKSLLTGSKILVAVLFFFVTCNLVIVQIVFQKFRNDLLEAHNISCNTLANQILNNLIEHNNNMIKTIRSDLLDMKNICLSYGEFVSDSGGFIDVKYTDWCTNKVHLIKTPLWRFGNQTIHNNFTIVDEVERITGKTCTIFQKIEKGDFLRISTTLRREDGSRGVGTFLPSNSPIAQSLMKKKPYTGKSFVLTKDYIAAYDPLINNKGEVIGAICVCTPLLNDEFYNTIQNIKLKYNGYFFLIDTKGKFIFHPKYGNILKEDYSIIEKLLSTGNKEGYIEYNDNIEQEQVVIRFNYFKEWECYVCNVIYQKSMILETYKSHYILYILILFFTICFIVCAILLSSKYYSIKTASFLDNVTMSVEEIIAGNLDGADINSNVSDQMGKLAVSINKLRKTLKTLVSGIRRSEEKYRDLYNNAPFIYLSICKSGVITECNSTALIKLGCNRDDLIGKKVKEVFVELNEEKLWRSLDEKLAVNNIETVLSIKNGIEKQVSLDAASYCGASGKIESIRCAVTDISDRKSLETKLREKNRILEQINKIDALTAVYNRRYLMETFEVEFEKAGRYAYPLSILMLDLDRFKQVNDYFGHQAGDKILAIIAELLKKNVRQGDIVARFGGEEFIILAPCTDINGAYDLSDKLRGIIEKDGGFEIEKDVFINVTASFGVANYFNNNYLGLNSFLQAADDALLKSKRSGRNKVTLHESNPLI